MKANRIYGGRKAGIRFLPIALSLVFLSGCAFFQRGAGKSAEDAAAESAFETQRSEQEKMSEFAASAGRKNPNEKRSVPKWETFLLSDKAKEIYANTER